MKKILYSLILLINFPAFAQLPLPYEVSNTIRPYNIQMADLNSDGLEDIVGGTSEGIAWCRKNPDGTFDPVTHFIYDGGGTWAGHNLAGLVDIDNDGDIDIFKTYFTGEGNTHPQLNLMKNNGGMVFGNPVLVVEAFGQMQPVFDDFNNDGWVDMALGHINDLHIYQNNGAGALVFLESHPSNDNYNYRLTVIDLNQDGIKDLYFVGNSYQSLLYLQGTGDGTFENPIVLETSNESVGDYIMADVNSDLFPDLIYSTNIGDQFYPLFQYSLRLNLGNGNLGNAIILDFTTSMAGYQPVVSIDWSGDGYDDLIFFDSDNQSNYSAVFYTWSNNTLSSTSNLAVDYSMCFAAKYVIETDDDPEEEIMLDDFSNRWQLYQISNGVITNPEPDYDNSLGTYHDEVVVDFDNDGDLDIVSSCNSNGRIGWYENLQNGFSAFQLLALINASQNMVSPLAVFDQNGDGDNDIFLIDGPAHSLFYENNGDGTGVSQFIATNLQTTDLSPIDLNNDSMLDLVTIDYNNGELVYIPGGNSIDFSSPIIIDSDVLDKLCIDMDNDGDEDLIYLKNNGSITTLTQLINTGGNFSEWINHSNTLDDYTLDSYIGLSTIDYDNDGWRDIISDLGWTEAYKIFFNSESGITNSQEFPGYLYAEVPNIYYNNDSLQDLMIGTSTFPIILMNQGNGNFTPAGYVPFVYWSNQGIGTFDFDNDGSYEYLRVTQDEIYIDPLLMEAFVAPVEGYVFHDQNGNGVFDTGDNFLPGMDVSIDSGNESAIVSTGSGFILTGQTGNFVITPEYDNSIWQLTTDSTSYHIQIDTPGDVPNYPLVFGLQAIGDQPDVIVNSSPDIWNCIDSSFVLHTYILNVGNSYLSGVASMTFDDDMLDIINLIDTPDSIIGNTIYWSAQNLLPEAYESFKVTFTNPDVSLMGQILEINTSFTRLVSNNEEPLTVSHTNNWEVTCAYDPNDKQVSPSGFSNNGFIENNTDLTYIIRFQNTGNATATNVTILDQLSEYLDRESIEVLSYSHPVTMTLTEDGQISFYFQEIMLPDSGSNEIESHGFVTYRISPEADLEPGTAIMNTAFIYFDYNPEIVTNTTLNTIYTCEWLHSNILIYMENNELIAPFDGLSYQWLLNGIAIPGAEAHTIEPVNPGGYSVVISYNDGCEVESPQFFYLVENVENLPTTNELLFPNPTSGEFNIVFGSMHNTIKIFDLTGRLVYQNMFAGKTGNIQLENEPSGIYTVHFFDEKLDLKKTKRLVIQK